MPRVYAGGDIVIGEGTVIEAMGWGRIAATTAYKDLAIEKRWNTTIYKR
jgi:thioredoxin reductase